MARVGLCLLLLACIVGSVLSEIAESSSFDLRNHRQLLAPKKKKLSTKERKALEEAAEKEREAQALEEFRIFQAKKKAEIEKILAVASDEADELITKLLKSDEKKRVKIIVSLWENAKGVQIMVLLNTLQVAVKDIDELVIKAMVQAENNGFGIKVAEAVAFALTIVDSEDGADPMLKIIMARKKALDDKKKGRGCEYVQFLLLDAEIFALESARALEFTQAFDAKKWLGISECFFDECTGAAIDCCIDDKVDQLGTCRCEPKTRVCEYNKFWSLPRSIWLCNTEDCFPDQKCMCPTKEKLAKIKAAKAKAKGKSKGKSKNKSKSKSKSKKSSKASNKKTKSSKGKGTK